MSLLPAPETLALYLAASVALILTPGPDTIYVLTRGAAGGRRTGALAALGVATGVLVHTTAAALGLAALLRASAGAFAAVRYAGAAYLVYLGLRTLAGRDDATDLVADGPTESAGLGRQPYLRGVAVNVLNPKVALFFLAFLPQFAGPSDATATMLLLGGLYAAITAGYLGLVGALSGRVGARLRGNARPGRGLEGVSGAVLVGLGAAVALGE